MDIQVKAPQQKNQRKQNVYLKIYITVFGLNIQKYHADIGALNSGIVALVLNIKTGYVSSQFHIIFDNYFTTTSVKKRKNSQTIGAIYSTSTMKCHQSNYSSA